MLSILLSSGSSLSFIMDSKRSTSALFTLIRYSRAASSLSALGMLPPCLGSGAASASRFDAASFFAMVPPSPPSHWRGGAGQAHRRWKMCDGWPAGLAPSGMLSRCSQVISRAARPSNGELAQARQPADLTHVEDILADRKIRDAA